MNHILVHNIQCFEKPVQRFTGLELEAEIQSTDIVLHEPFVEAGADNPLDPVGAGDADFLPHVGNNLV
ncbi:MAG: hypothetical protein ACOCX6_02105 [bacterium]